MVLMATATSSVGAAVDVGEVIREALRIANMSPKEACLLMEVDPARFSRACDGLPGNALDLWKLARLPWRFWSVFIPKFVAAHTAVWLSEWKESA